MKYRGNEIIIIWIPSHIGHLGNEYVDNAAKRTLNLPLIIEFPYFPRSLVKYFFIEQMVRKRPNRSLIFQGNIV